MLLPQRTNFEKFPFPARGPEGIKALFESACDRYRERTGKLPVIVIDAISGRDLYWHTCEPSERKGHKSSSPLPGLDRPGNTGGLLDSDLYKSTAETYRLFWTFEQWAKEGRARVVLVMERYASALVSDICEF